MSSEIRVPMLGESIVDGTIVSWLKKEGDLLQRGEVLVELETDKINIEVNAEQDGILQKIMKQVGDVVAVGEVIAQIAESAGMHGVERAETVPLQSTQTGPLGKRAVTSPLRPTATAEEALRSPSPLARRIAAEHNVDIAQIKGSSPHGRVTREDVIHYLEQSVHQLPTSTMQPVAAVQPSAQLLQPAPLALPVMPRGREERVRMSRRRQTIAQRLVEAQQTAAMLTTFNEIDMSAVMEIRSRRKDAFKERHGVGLGFMSFFTRAVVGALKAFPRLNAEIQGHEMVIKHYYDIGIAVGAEEGLVVPVVREADRKSFAEIEHEIVDLAKRARANTLTLADLQGGTFTITNGGIFGSLLSTPILNAPQVAILGMHKIEQRPLAFNGQVVIRPMMYVALSYDHRIVDGREAVQFLVRVKELLEDPEVLLLEG
jgi:2-oxoglutarate dehydrogenase E2 component (dihydrolipoamide succinyltransferase)